MKTIYKYTVGYYNFGDNIIDIKVPKSAEFLSVHVQDDKICAWYFVNPEEEETRTVVWKQIGTGHLYDDDMFGTFAGTVVNDDAGLVWHMFYK